MCHLQKARCSLSSKYRYVDIRGYTPLELLFLYRRRARTLADAAKGTFGASLALASALLLPAADRASRRWLEKSHNPYLHEIADRRQRSACRASTR